MFLFIICVVLACLCTINGDITHETGRTGFFRSANWPVGNYLSDTNNRWILEAPASTRIRMTFANPFDVEYSEKHGVCMDYIAVIDGQHMDYLGEPCSNSVPTIVYLCGTDKPRDIVSPSSTVIVDFCTDRYVEGKGFGVYWDAEDEDFCGVPAITPDLPTNSLGSEQHGGFIVGGQHAVRNSYPWVGSVWATVGEESGHFCSCSLLKNQWCITAGHCLYENKLIDLLDGFSWNWDQETFRFHIKFGAQDVGNTWQKNEGTQQVMGVEKIFIHPLFNRETLQYDLSLVKLAAPVTYDAFVQPICLAPFYEHIPSSEKLVVIGWGNTDSGKSSQILNEVQVPYVPTPVCNSSSYYDGSVGNTMMCAGGQNGQGVCGGDSGGPLMWLKGDNRWWLEGTVSWGQECADRYPGVYQDVSVSRSWILETMMGN